MFRRRCLMDDTTYITHPAQSYAWLSRTREFRFREAVEFSHECFDRHSCFHCTCVCKEKLRASLEKKLLRTIYRTDSWLDAYTLKIGIKNKKMNCFKDRKLGTLFIFAFFKISIVLFDMILVFRIIDTH